MNIIIEGPDACGKTTLAIRLADQLGRVIIKSEGQEKQPGEMAERLTIFRAYKDVVFDRHPIVSDVIYGTFRGYTPITPQMANEFYAVPAVFIACLTPIGEHVTKVWDSEKHLDMIKTNFYSIQAAYHVWAREHAHIIYRPKDDLDLLYHMLKGVPR